jgi:imidazole glycerol-phosphate synthase subunit HisF
MLMLRIIPVLLLENGRMVKTIRFENTREVGNPATAVRVLNAQGADEIVFLNIDSNNGLTDSFLNIIEKAASEAFIPLTAGGGIKDLDDITKLLQIGADKVSINTIATINPNFIRNASERFGRNCIVISIDVRKIDGHYFVFSNGGTINTGLNPVSFAKKCEELGAGEILLSSIDRDGTMLGYDLDLIKVVSEAVGINVIANSGVGNLSHFIDAIDTCKSNAIAASSIYHFTDQHIIKVKSYIKSHGYHVRTT